MADTQSLFDTLAGSFGHGVDRPGLNAFVANSQSMNGLRSAQTEEALTRAQQEQEEMNAHSQLESSLTGVLGDDGKPLLQPSQAHLVANELKGKFGNAQVVMQALQEAQKAHNTGVLSDPNNLNTPAATAAASGIQGKLPEPVAAPPTMVVPAGVTPNIQQTPQGVAQTKATSALANLNQTKSDAGGFAPKAAALGVNPEQAAALTKAVSEGRLDPTRVNSRNAPILGQMELTTPGMNFNGMHADAALQANAGFQQKAISMDAMPTILSHMTTLGKKLNGGTGYSDVKAVGQMQQWMNGQLNDPDYTEYMTVRNDALMKLASVMRGVGMSDQAHAAEVQAAAPTLSPLALDAWLKGQMATIEPLLARTQAVEHLGGSRAGNPGPASSSSGAALPAYPSEAAAIAAGHKAGDRVMINGVTGTLQ
jgi:hypothetical protein